MNPGNRTEVTDAKDAEQDCENTDGNPIVYSTGNKVEPEVDFTTSGEMPLHLKRTYNHYWHYKSLFGGHWNSSFDYSLTVQPVVDGRFPLLWLQRPDGRRIKFNRSARVTGRWTEDKESPVAYITQAGDGSYTHYTEDNTIERYNSAGFMIERKNRQGIGWTFTYVNSYLDRVTHSSGRHVQFGWTGNQLTSVTDPAGNVFVYTYAANTFGYGWHRLASTTMPGSPSTTITYHYENLAYRGALTGKSYNGVRYSTFMYDALGRAARSEHAGGVDAHQFAYQASGTSPPPNPPPLPPPPGNGGYCDPQNNCHHPQGSGHPVHGGDSTGYDDLPRASEGYALASANNAATLTVTHTTPLGHRSIHQFVDGRLISVEGQATASGYCAARYRSKTYDANGFTDKVTDYLGYVTDFDYDTSGRLLKKVEALGRPEARTSHYAWNIANNRLSDVTVVGERTTSYTYTASHRPWQITITNLNPNGPASSRTTTYTYTQHTNGMVASVVADGPRPGLGDALTMMYSSAGNLTSVSNSLGHSITYGNHTGLGQPRLVTGLNGEQSALTFDGRSRLVNSRIMVNGVAQNTGYDYYGSGQLSKISLPDGISRSFFYAANRRLVSITEPEADGKFAKRAFAYNAAGGVVSEVVSRVTPSGGGGCGAPPGHACPRPATIAFPGSNAMLVDGDVGAIAAYADSAGADRPVAPLDTDVVHRSYYTDYDELNRPRARRGNHQQEVRYSYDSNDNLVLITEFRNGADRVTSRDYDSLNRLVKVTDPQGGVTRYDYDKGDRVTRVTDPRNVQTTYKYDTFEQLWENASADSGTVNFNYDTYGRRTSMNRNGITTTYTLYDALDRVGRIASQGKQQNYIYDSCSNGIGRLCSIQDPYSTNEYTYTPHGWISGIQTIYTAPIQGSAQVSYYYDGMGRLATIGKPGGQRIHYDYAWGRPSTVTLQNGNAYQTIASNLRYDPMGPQVRMTYGNGLIYASSYDLDGRIASLNVTGTGSTGIQSLSYDWNRNNVITRVANAWNPALTQTFGYDTLARLETITSTSGNQSIGYDATGNRTWHTTGGGTTNYTTAIASNRLAGLTGATPRSYIYDSDGNATSFAGTTFTYDAFNRMDSATRNGQATQYAVNALGQRIIKQNPSQLRAWVYAPDGSLIKEYRSEEGNWSDYVRVNGQVIAMVRAGQIHYVTNDHLGRPDTLTNTNKATVWKASNFAFDRTVTTDTIGGLSLGFPGQVQDSETGLWHNGFRDYDAVTGRYIQSDPIGLAAGLNTYSYVGGSPVVRIDPWGLAQEDIDCMYALAKDIEIDLKFPRKHPVTKDFGPPDKEGNITLGMWNPVTRQISISDVYLEPLSIEMLESLYDTLVHEVLHPNWGRKGSSGAGHDALYAEARRRMISANPSQRCYCGK